MLPRRKMALLCRTMMFLWACYWCLGGFTPDRVWAAEETSAQSSPKTDASGEEYSFFRPSADYKWRFFPTPEEIQKYRQSWNPFSHGPILANSPDVQPKNQWLVQLYVFSQTGTQQYNNKFTTKSTDASTHLNAVLPTLFLGYGITDNLEVDVAPTLIWYNARHTSVT